MKRAALAIVLLALVGAGVWLGGERETRDEYVEPLAFPPTPTAAPPPSPSAPGSGQVAAAAGTASTAVLLHPPGLAPVLLQEADVPWERQIGAITRLRDVPDRLKARLLLQMLPGLPAEAQATAAEEAAQRVPDVEYAAALLPAVVDPQTHGAAMSALFADLMERPDAIALPALLAVARNPAHPFAPSAQDNLRLLLGADFGGDWGRWETAIQRRLRPDGRAPR